MEDRATRSRSLVRLRNLYEAYYEKCASLEQDRKPFAGVFGLSKGPADDPCHDRFAQDIAELLEEFRSEKPDSGEIRELLRFIYEAPLGHAEPRFAYWMLLAVHGLSLELIEGLDAEDAAGLRAWYAEAYPKRQRVPVQNKLLKALDARC